MIADRVHIPPWEVADIPGDWYWKIVGVIREEAAGRRDAERRQRRKGGRAH